MSFREQYGLPPKITPRCPDCGVEHRGKCFYLRNRRMRSISPEKIAEYQRSMVARRLIKRLGEWVDEARDRD